MTVVYVGGSAKELDIAKLRFFVAVAKIAGRGEDVNILVKVLEGENYLAWGMRSVLKWFRDHERLNPEFVWVRSVKFPPDAELLRALNEAGVQVERKGK